jgi:XTP/dITP diphosphohydrolase
MEPIVLATGYPHKVDELRAIVAEARVPVLGLRELPNWQTFTEPAETGTTFEENATIKALSYARQTGLPCLADDSGLEVDALAGEPGLRSARWAGPTATDAERIAKLLGALAGVPGPARGARFVCVASVADPSGTILAEARGTYEGSIADGPRGKNGFGYDPLLYLADRGCSSAELEPEEKHARSHRGKAFRALAEQLRTLAIR